MIYLDNNATTPLAPQVANAISKCLRENYGNPSSSHAFGIRAKKAVENARKQTADLVGAAADDIPYTRILSIPISSERSFSTTIRIETFVAPFVLIV